MTDIEKAWLLYRKKLLVFIRSKVATEQDAEDVLSDVFVKLAYAVSQQDMPENISAWLYRVTKNCIVDYYRARKTVHTEVDGNIPTLIEESDDMANLIALSACMRPMINVLPDTYRQAVLLSEIEGKKHQEVARYLQISLSAAKSRVLRGRKKLHEMMLDCCRVEQNKAGAIVSYESKSAKGCQICK